MTVLEYHITSGALGLELQTVSTLPDGYDFTNHGAGTALNAEGGTASGPNSAGDMKNPSTDLPSSRQGWNQTNTCA